MKNFYEAEIIEMLATEKLYFKDEINNVAVFYEKQLSASTLSLYWDALQAYELEDIKTAIRKHIADPKAGKYMPRASDLIAAMERSGIKKPQNKSAPVVPIKIIPSDLDLKIDREAKEFAEQAKAQGISNYEFFKRLCKHNKEFAAYAKLAGLK